MEKKNIIIIFAIAIIAICLIVGINNNKKEDLDNGVVTSSYREINNEVTGEKYYQVYNENTGEIIANVTEEYQVDIYLDNPDYVENNSIDDTYKEEEFLED